MVLDIAPRVFGVLRLCGHRQPFTSVRMAADDLVAPSRNGFRLPCAEIPR
jgi:hypothetical protein